MRSIIKVVASPNNISNFSRTSLNEYDADFESRSMPFLASSSVVARARPDPSMSREYSIALFSSVAEIGSESFPPFDLGRVNGDFPQVHLYKKY
jgi:hypothetical protein